MIKCKKTNKYDSIKAFISTTTTTSTTTLIKFLKIRNYINFISKFLDNRLTLSLLFERQLRLPVASCLTVGGRNCGCLSSMVVARLW